MPYVPTKRCDRADRHEEHEWKQGAFKRRCPGRTSTRRTQKSRNKNKQ